MCRCQDSMVFSGDCEGPGPGEFESLLAIDVINAEQRNCGTSETPNDSHLQVFIMITEQSLDFIQTRQDDTSLCFFVTRYTRRSSVRGHNHCTNREREKIK